MGASKPGFADIQFCLPPMLHSVNDKVVDATMGTRAAKLWSTCSLLVTFHFLKVYHWTNLENFCQTFYHGLQVILAAYRQTLELYS